MTELNYTQKFIELVIDGEEEYTFTYLDVDKKWREYTEDEVETFNVFDQWKEEQAEILIREHLQKLDSLYKEHFAWILNAIPFLSDYMRTIEHGIRAYKVNTPIGFRYKFNAFINKYHLQEYSELLMIFLVDAKLTNDVMVAHVSTKEGVKLLQDYFDDLKSLNQFHRRMANPEYRLKQVSIVFNQGGSVVFKNPLVIHNLLLRKGILDENIEQELKYQKYHKNKLTINKNYLQSVVTALYNFLKKETSYFPIEGSFKNDDLRVINEFIILSGLPIYDQRGNPKENIYDEAERIKIIRNWLSE